VPPGPMLHLTDLLPSPTLLLSTRSQQVMAPSRTVVAYVKAPEDGQQHHQQQQQQHQHQQQPWDLAGASSSSGGRFSAYIQSRERSSGGESRERNGSSNGAAGSNGASESGGRFAAYIREREQQRGQSSSGGYDDRRTEQSWQQNGSNGHQGEGRFASYLASRGHSN